MGVEAIRKKKKDELALSGKIGINNKSVPCHKKLAVKYEISSKGFFEIDRNIITKIGRTKENDIHMDNELVSKTHALISY